MNVREFGRSIGESALRRVGRVASRLQEEFPLDVDLLESDDEYLVVFDAPGAAAGDVQVRYDEGEVHVRVDRFREYREGFETLAPGRGLTLEGSVSLPPDAEVDPDAARARLNEDGTLYVFLPKSRETGAEPETVEIDESVENGGDEASPGESGDESDADA